MKYKKGTFTIIPNKETLKGKSPLTLSVYFWICSFADDNGICYPSITTISEYAGCSRNGVISSIKALVDIGLLEKTSRTKNNEKQSNIYQIMIVGGSAPDKLGSAPNALGSAHSELGGSAPSDHRTISTLLTKPINYRKKSQAIKTLEEFIQKSETVILKYEKELYARKDLLRAAEMCRGHFLALPREVKVASTTLNNRLINQIEWNKIKKTLAPKYLNNDA